MSDLIDIERKMDLYKSMFYCNVPGDRYSQVSKSTTEDNHQDCMIAELTNCSVSSDIFSEECKSVNFKTLRFRTFLKLKKIMKCLIGVLMFL